jgi:fido (protein-threonine AMPylation protein)
MTQPQDIQNDISGVSGNGNPEPWRLVAVRHPRKIGDIVNDPTRQAWNSTHNGVNYAGTFDAYEQQVGIAEQIAFVHPFSDGQTRDVGDVLIELMEFAIQWRKANNLPTSAK